MKDRTMGIAEVGERGSGGLLAAARGALKAFGLAWSPETPPDVSRLEAKSWKELRLQGGSCRALDCRGDHDLVELAPACHRVPVVAVLDRDQPRLILQCSTCGAAVALVALKP